MGYAVFHATKGSGGGGKLGAHIDRDKTQKQTFKSADPEREHLNKDLINNRYSTMKLPDAINARIKEGYKGKTAIRKDAVKFIPMVMTGSHEEMKDIFKSSEKANAWVKANYDFVCKEFGKENIVRFTLHLDEKTPHIHAVVVPLTDDGRLSAKERFGNRNDLSDRQTRYAEQMSPFVLKNISTHIPYGKITAIVGASGSGKTTLLKIILKIYPICKGEISYHGNNISILSPKSIRENS